MMPARQPKIFAAVLAAGQSSRFGQSKQAAKLDGRPLIERATTTAADVCGPRVVTVLGHDWQALLRLLPPHAGFVTINEDYAQGLGSSIAAAARACRPHADALLLLLADQPLVTAEHLKTLIETWSGADNEIVATAFADTEGPPVLFAGTALQELLTLDGNRGAHALFRDGRFTLKTVKFEAAAVDIDTPDDLATLT